MDVQAQGYISKSKSMEDVLKSSDKMEARLVGYDETPVDVSTPDAIGIEKSMVQQSFGREVEPQSSPCATPVIKRLCEGVRGTAETPSCDLDSQTTGTIIAVAGYVV